MEYEDDDFLDEPEAEYAEDAVDLEPSDDELFDEDFGADGNYADEDD